MKTIIAGSRTVSRLSIIPTAVRESGFRISMIISGGTQGVDRLGELYVAMMKIPLTIKRADWDRYGKSAGYLRNVEMAKEADALIAIWDDVSRGTKHMIDIATERQLKVYIFKVT